MSTAASTFTTHPYFLKDLLRDCESGKLQLPDFQRSWVWDEDRISSLIASVSRGFPVGALMTLESGGNVEFKPRPVEGAPEQARAVLSPESLLLDGQQRMTSLYQVTLRDQVVHTVTPKHKKVKRWFYIDINKALDPDIDREEAIVGVPEDRIVRSNFGREVSLDLSTRELEIENLMYPMSMVFRWDDWMDAVFEWGEDRENFKELRTKVRQFKTEVLDNFANYQVPVIALGKSTSKEAVCVVFEKVNTGGKPLDAFELITAMYAVDGHELRRDWYGDEQSIGRQARLKEALRLPSEKSGVLSGVGNTDFLQVVSLFHTRDNRRKAAEEGKQGKDLPKVSANRQSLLSLPLESYLRYQELADDGFLRAAKFLIGLGIYRVYDLPYQSQIVPLAAILADLGNRIEITSVRDKVVQWYWNGVFGELYGSTTDTRIAKDFLEVPAWIDGGVEPSTVTDAAFRAERLKTMRMRLSAAYKGVNALLLRAGAKDFRTGQQFVHTVFFDENVDIHHIFPQDWCKAQGIDRTEFDSIINKTPLSARTNRIIGGSAPSAYLGKLESTDASDHAEAHAVDEALRSHLIDPALLRADDFAGFMRARQEELVLLIEEATGRSVFREFNAAEEDDAEDDTDENEAEMTIAS
ncbi:DUF262 domain-containing protein [Salinibacterium sp. SWN248]|uniref:GmrSD restriction endonuclease domain-containing protein n=1 Tax=Salinibacterium sp. SWN248 TaxID=2792056 RepID=UPI0018CF3AD9|nr:DUF262 domain-containing protein [Salinibacterium sp. SWN248]MBH0022657.1 DUF262 domain-containing protein [Salinibacterium sp. SWN248]